MIRKKWPLGGGGAKEHNIVEHNVFCYLFSKKLVICYLDERKMKYLGTKHYPVALVITLKTYLTKIKKMSAKLSDFLKLETAEILLSGLAQQEAERAFIGMHTVGIVFVKFTAENCGN